MGPVGPCPPPAPQLLLLVLFSLCFPTALWGDVVFLPPFIRMFDTSVTAALVGDLEDVDVSLTVWDGDLGILLLPDCGLQNNGTSTWSLTVTPDVMGSEVTVRFNGDLQACISKLDFFFSDYPCVIETLVVSASRNSSCLAHLLIQVEIYPNTSFAPNISDNGNIFTNQRYRPFGSCPCNLVAGACDIRCCCDKECTPALIDLFKEDCFTGVFGGEVNPPFDHLCSNPITEEMSDWFPFLCVHSSLNNTPFLGYFFEGSISHNDDYSFTAPLNIRVRDWSDFGYVQNSPLMTVEEVFFTVPQTSIVGQCVEEAPVAFLQNFDVNCVNNLAKLQEWRDISQVRIKNGTIGGFLVPQVTYEESTALDRFIRDTEIFLHPGPSFKNVNVEEHYTFMWRDTTLTGLSVKVIWAKIDPDQQGTLTRRFKATFLSFNFTEAPKRSGNPGYSFGKPVRALNIRSVDNITTLNLWQPVGRGLCTEAGTTPVLFGEDAVSGCLLELGMDENCTQLRADVTNRLNSLVQATHVAEKGNSDYLNLLDGWLDITWRDAPSPGDNLHLKDIKGLCPDVPAMMTIQFLISDGGNLEGIAQYMILGTEVSFSSVTWQFPCGLNCEDKPSVFPISVSVRFIKIPPDKPLTSFQISHTSRDCVNNEVCWPELIFPFTGHYQGESYSSSVTKSLMLVFSLIVIILFNTIGMKIFSVWDLFFS